MVEISRILWRNFLVLRYPPGSIPTRRNLLQSTLSKPIPTPEHTEGVPFEGTSPLKGILQVD
jgi:hypothetical protein